MEKIKVDTSDIEECLKRQDPQLGKIIDAVVAKIGPQRPSHTHQSEFEALACSIISQQLSVKAAASIYRRFKEAFKGPISPARVKAFTLTDLQSLGLSRAKAVYMHNLADWFSLHAHKLVEKQLKDEDLVTLLTEISGIGVWTVQMFLIFYLKRPDILPLNDLGIQKGVQLILGLQKPAAPRTILIKAKQWQPFRSIACLYLWRALDLGLHLTFDAAKKSPIKMRRKIKTRARVLPTKHRRRAVKKA